MAIDKKTFLKTVTILHDTREQKNAHIIEALDKLGVKHEERKLDYGDYSFTADGRDFSMSCVVERKANVDEIYNNVTSDRGQGMMMEISLCPTAPPTACADIRESPIFSESCLAISP